MPKSGVLRLCGFPWARLGRGNLSFFFLCNFRPLHVNFVGNPTSVWPLPDFPSRESGSRPHGFWQITCQKEEINSLTQPRRANLVFYFHCVKRDILGIEKVHGFETDWVVLEGKAWLVKVCRGVLHGRPWENRQKSRLWHLGHNAILLWKHSPLLAYISHNTKFQYISTSLAVSKSTCWIKICKTSYYDKFLYVICLAITQSTRFLPTSANWSRFPYRDLVIDHFCTFLSCVDIVYMFSKWTWLQAFK